MSAGEMLEFEFQAVLNCIRRTTRQRGGPVPKSEIGTIVSNIWYGFSKVREKLTIAFIQKAIVELLSQSLLTETIDGYELSEKGQPIDEQNTAAIEAKATWAWKDSAVCQQLSQRMHGPARRALAGLEPTDPVPEKTELYDMMDATSAAVVRCAALEAFARSETLAPLTMLDVGCGTGGVFEALRSNDALCEMEATLLDSNPITVERLNTQYESDPGVRVVRGDHHALNLSMAERFHFISCIDMLYFIHKAEQQVTFLLALFHRLAVNGKLVVHIASLRPEKTALTKSDVEGELLDARSAKSGRQHIVKLFEGLDNAALAITTTPQCVFWDGASAAFAECDIGEDEAAKGIQAECTKIQASLKQSPHAARYTFVVTKTKADNRESAGAGAGAAPFHLMLKRKTLIRKVAN